MTGELERVLDALKRRPTGYTSQSARDAERTGYGDRAYWDYLEAAALERRDYYLRHRDPDTAERMMTRTLSESLMGNDGP
jgi:hypothetical protein